MQQTTHVVFGSAKSFLDISYPFNGWFNIHNSRKKIIRVSNQSCIWNFSCSPPKNKNSPINSRSEGTNTVFEGDSGKRPIDNLWRTNSHYKSVDLSLLFGLCSKVRNKIISKKSRLLFRKIIVKKKSQRPKNSPVCSLYNVPASFTSFLHLYMFQSNMGSLQQQ